MLANGPQNLEENFKNSVFSYFAIYRLEVIKLSFDPVWAKINGSFFGWLLSWIPCLFSEAFETSEDI